MFKKYAFVLLLVAGNIIAKDFIEAQRGIDIRELRKPVHYKDDYQSQIEQKDSAFRAVLVSFVLGGGTYLGLTNRKYSRPVAGIGSFALATLANLGLGATAFKDKNYIAQFAGHCGGYLGALVLIACFGK